jgi:secreted trypsin-like serine protease/subtilisin family serine protease
MLKTHLFLLLTIAAKLTCYEMSRYVVIINKNILSKLLPLREQMNTKINYADSSFLSRFATLLITLVLVAFLPRTIHAQERQYLSAQAGVPVSQQTDISVKDALKELREAATQHGLTRVIVGLRVPFESEGRMSEAKSGKQRSEIAEMQIAVLAKVSSRASTHRFASVPFMVLEVDARELDLLTQTPEVTSLQPDRLSKPTLDVSVPAINGTGAWSSGFTGAGQTVAVLDSGVDKTHPFLNGKVVSEACFSSSFLSQSSTSVCPGGVSASTASGSAIPCTATSCDHGTHVAGIVAGTGGGVNFSGVAKDATLIAIQVFSQINNAVQCGASTPCISAYDSDVIKGLERVYALRNVHNISSVNMSLGGGRYFNQSSCDASNPLFKSSIDNLRSVGIATVVASGNDGFTDSIASPACISTAVSVGATYVRSGYVNSCQGGYNLGSSGLDSIGCFSNSASFLSLLAPGGAISSSLPGGLLARKWGTSMAAPHVAGAWAIMKNKMPAATVSDVLNAFTSTGKLVTDPRNFIAKPRIDVTAALASLGGAGATTYPLALTRLGSGSGNVVSSPSGISCGTDCSESYASGTNVVLTAAASSGSTFGGWGGACLGTSSACVVSMTAAKSVSATFTLVPVTRMITVVKSGTGTGTVSSSPSGISCGTSCGVASVSFSTMSNVTISAVAAAGSSFAGWSGACSGVGSCTVAAGTNSISVGAIFNTSSSGGSVTALQNGVSVASLSGASASSKLFSIAVPAGATNLSIRTSGGTGDVDLFTRFGQLPTTSVYDCMSAALNNTESCTNSAPSSGTYYVMLYGYSAYSGLTVTASYSTTSGPSSYLLTVNRAGTGSGLVQSTSVVPSAMVSLQTSAASVKYAVSPVVDTRIVGGSAAAAGAWPWQVQLSINYGGSTYLCGGALLSNQWVLTAAHCIEKAGATLNPSAVTVRAGSLTLSSGGQTVAVSRIIKHESYSASTKDNDIAMLQLSSPVALSSAVNVVKPLLASQESILAATNILGTVTGWGATSSGGSISSVLLQVQVPLWTSADCAAMTANGSSITNNMICAGYLSGGKDSCQGDSGGPLVVPNGPSGYALAGIVSWGYGCAAANAPGVYTRVANYTAWLQSNSGLVFDGTTNGAINCGSVCSASFYTNNIVTLNATAASGSTFTGWSGACSGTGSCVVTMSAAKTVTASFTSNGGSSVITGTSGNDTLVNSSGNNTVDGKAGIDTYVSFGPASQYSLGRGASAWNLADGVSTDGIDALTNVERLRFSTGLHLLDIDKGQIGGMAYRIYKAAFNRQPDNGGLKYWVGRMDSDANVIDVAAGFIASAEFVALYGISSSDGDFITRIYSNVLNRAPDAGGFNYWVGVLSRGTSRQEVLAGFSESDENIANVAATIANGIWLPN